MRIKDLVAQGMAEVAKTSNLGEAVLRQVMTEGVRVRGRMSVTVRTATENANLPFWLKALLNLFHFELEYDTHVRLEDPAPSSEQTPSEENPNGQVED